MTGEAKIQEAAQANVSLPIPDRELRFNWRHCWYPVTFIRDLPIERAYSFSIHDEPFVMFRNQDGTLACLTDRCPHRAAKLSDGQIIDGKIECLFHGWQFSTDGQCLHIPQLPTEDKIPAKACVPSFTVVERQGIVWVWLGELEAADKERIPIIPDLDKPEFVNTDFVGDLPYDQSYLIEHALDPAHANISHHGSEGNRESAKPLEMEVSESSATGIRGRFRGKQKPNANWVKVDFVAPNFVYYKLDFEKEIWGLALYSIPLGKGRSRVLFRSYSNNNFFTWKVKLTPRWLDHWFRNKVVEEDLPLFVGVQEQVERLGRNLKEVYLPLKTSDRFVIEYRKWLDKFGASLPFYQGYSTSQAADSNGECNAVLLGRFSQHTLICSSCHRAYQVTNRLKKTLVAVAIGLTALAIVTDGFGHEVAAVSASLSAVALAAVVQIVKTRFERSYKRR
ncbi:MAG: Rieske 2Fe-2S domain-containing protein [Nostoc indistinguendum CM1-VF10]|jgi:phenylpropionate dioxygenase-like ring-hydroxylating dioxygenase large terminal subunit|nr:Rieske 2Fe-2S domain-containing protein [Nostoc indistinguendum CM1-VF10]